jgi:hypothetical protein
LHAPVLLEAHFNTAGTTLTVRFDEQPTNRAGMNGQSPCSMVLDSATMVRICENVSSLLPVAHP